jgi:hypothetical protein
MWTATHGEHIESTNDDEDEVESDCPELWFDQVSKIEKFKEFKDYKIIYLYFTNANIPKKANEIVNKGGNKIIFEKSVFKTFLSLNIFPFSQVFDFFN